MVGQALHLSSSTYGAPPPEVWDLSERRQHTTLPTRRRTRLGRNSMTDQRCDPLKEGLSTRRTHQSTDSGSLLVYRDTNVAFFVAFLGEQWPNFSIPRGSWALRRTRNDQLAILMQWGPPIEPPPTVVFRRSAGEPTHTSRRYQITWRPELPRLWHQETSKGTRPNQREMVGPS